MESRVTLQGETSGWAKPPVHIKSEVPFWPGLRWTGQNETFVLMSMGGLAWPDVSPCILSRQKIFSFKKYRTWGFRGGNQRDNNDEQCGLQFARRKPHPPPPAPSVCNLSSGAKWNRLVAQRAKFLFSGNGPLKYTRAWVLQPTANIQRRHYALTGWHNRINTSNRWIQKIQEHEDNWIQKINLFECVIL